MKASKSGKIPPFLQGRLDHDYREPGRDRHADARGRQPRPRRASQLIDWHVREGTDGIVVVGTTGESPTVDFDEHYELIQVAVEHAAGRIPVIAGTGANSTARSDRTDRVCEAGRRRHGACRSCRTTTSRRRKASTATSARLPRRSTFRTSLQRAGPYRGRSCERHHAASRAGAEHRRRQGCHGNIERGCDLLRRRRRISPLYSGDDATCVALILLGGHGIISVTANVAPRLMHEMCVAALEPAMSAARARTQYQAARPASQPLRARPIRFRSSGRSRSSA